MRVDVSYKPIAGVRAFRLMMLGAGPRLVGTVTRHIYDGPVSHMDTAPPTRLLGGDEDYAPGAYRRWSQPGFFAFPEDAFNPGYAGGFFPVVGRVSFFGTVVRHAAGARGQVMRIDKLWVAQGMWGRPQPHALYEPPYHERLGIPPEASAIYYEWPALLDTLLRPAAGGGPLGTGLSDELGAAYGCEVELLVTPLSHPRTLEGAGFKLAPQDEWSRPVHRTMLIDIPQGGQHGDPGAAGGGDRGAAGAGGAAADGADAGAD
jgi:hypothetical protein